MKYTPRIGDESLLPVPYFTFGGGGAAMKVSFVPSDFWMVSALAVAVPSLA